MTSPWRGAALAALLLAPVRPTLAQDPLLDDDTRRVRRRFERLVTDHQQALAPELWELAEWCGEQRLFLERDRIAQLVIEIDPDHSRARKVLRYLPRGDGWVRSRTYRTPRNFGSDEDEAEYGRRLVAVMDPYRARVFRALERDGRKLAPGARERVLRRLLLLDPDDAALRTVLGERRLGDRWVLEETWRASRAGTGVAVLVEQALERVDRPELDAPTDEERALSLAWNAARRTPRVRVVGTTPRREVSETARISETMRHLFHRVFEHGQDPRRGFTIYLLKGSGERDELLAGLEVDDATRDHLRRAAGGWLSRERLGEWDANPARRLDGAARQTLGAMLMDAYGIGGDQGWAWEGMGLYLVYHVVGTRMTYFFDRGGTASARKTTLWPQLQAPDTRWLVEARRLLASDRAPSLQFLLGRSVDTMRDEDILAAYALAAYLFEGRPDDVPRILGRIGEGEHPVSVFEEVTGHALQDLETRLLRWLGEVLQDG